MKKKNDKKQQKKRISCDLLMDKCHNCLSPAHRGRTCSMTLTMKNKIMSFVVVAHERTISFAFELI